MKRTPKEVLKISKGDTEIASFISELLAQNQKLNEMVETLSKQIIVLETHVKELDRRLGQNSKNSSKPPSSDGLRKPTNLRQPGGKNGAPKGHKGHTLEMSTQPDEILIHPLDNCPNCTASLHAIAAEDHVRRQVLDLPLPRLIVTEHQAEVKRCPHCSKRGSAAFPDGVKAPVQYGDGFSAWTSYLNAYQLLPLERIGQLFADLTGHRPSEATLLSQTKAMAAALQSQVIPVIQDQLRNQTVLHTDETGARLAGKQHWLHVVSNAEWTLMEMYLRRGIGAIEGMGVLDTFRGIVVHDCLSAYFSSKYPFEHALCNAHLLRECLGIAQNDKHTWAKLMKELLQLAWELAKAARAKGIPLEDETITEIELYYDDILERGKVEWAQDPVPVKTGPRGRKAKSTAANLGQRFEIHKTSILRFIWDASVPFDNNQAERDIRMTKVKQKISGAFRTVEGGEIFATIRSFISTILKQNRPIYSSLVSALRGQFSF